jgi:GNAT superfamily N-acetyltransferase
MAAALVYPFYFNRSHRTAQELFWWVDEDALGTGAGVRLLKELERAAKERGAHSLSMIALDKIDGPQVERLYQHFDYIKSEQAFLKVL